MTTLNTLSNELIFGLFGYLTATDILRAFYRVNEHFDDLIVSHIIHNNATINKDGYKIISERNFPSREMSSVNTLQLNVIWENTRSLFGEERTITLDKFKALKLLILHKIDSPDTLQTILEQCVGSNHLTYLKIVEPFNYTEADNSFSWINYVWNLPKLTHFYLHDLRGTCRLQSQPPTRPSKIAYLLLRVTLHRDEALEYVFRHTPELKHLQIHDFSCCSTSNFQFDSTLPSLQLLKMKFYGSSLALKALLEKIPDLLELELQVVCKADTNDYDWGASISEVNFRKLRKIRLRLLLHFNGTDSEEEQVNCLLSGFRNSFWSDRNLYFRCIWHQSSLKKSAILYHAPYVLDDFKNSANFRFASNYSNNQYFGISDCIDTFRYTDEKNDLLTAQSSFYSTISSIRQLYISLPFQQDSFFPIVPKLHRLSVLNVKILENSNYDQLKFIVEHAPFLKSLSIEAKSFASLISNSFDSNDQSIRHLTLSGGSMDEAGCTALYNSSLGKQCESLTVTLHDYKLVPNLIARMPELRLFKFLYKPNHDQHEAPGNSNTEMIRWLNETQSNVYSIISSPASFPYVVLTINRNL